MLVSVELKRYLKGKDLGSYPGLVLSPMPNMKKTLGYTSGTAKSTHGCSSEGEVGGGWIERNKKATNSTHRQTLYRPPQRQRSPVTEERTFPHHPYEDIPMQRPLPELSFLPATRTGKASASSKRERNER